MTIPLNRDFNHIPNYSSLESKNNDIIIDIPNDTATPANTPFSPSPEAIASWQRNFSNLPSVKKTLLSLLGVGGLGASVLAAGLSKGDRDLVIAGSALCSATFAAALAAVFPKTQPTQTMAAVIEQLHQLIDRYPDYDTIINRENNEKFNEDLHAIISREIDEIPVSARGNGNSEVLLNHCRDVFMKFSSFDEPSRSEDVANLKIIIRNVVQDFCENAKEVDARIEADKQIIHGTFFENQQPLGTFQIKFDSGETHHHGRLVAFVVFNENDNQKIVYKPRDMRVDALIAGSHKGSTRGLFSVVNELTNRGTEILPTYKFLNMETDGRKYGYAEFLSHEKSDYTLTMPEMEAYYRTMGAIQAISQLFGITDLHRQNIIVHEKKPFPIDLEVSFDLEALHQSGRTSTGLDNAIREYGIPTIGGGSRDTTNKLDLIENNKTTPMQQHYNKNKDRYLSEIEVGFEVIKQAILSENGQTRLEEFIRGIPDDLQTRFVPINTGDFMKIMRGNATFATKMLMKSINGNCLRRPLYQIKSPVTESQAQEDVLHADLPRLVADPQGGVHYNGSPFLEALDGKIKPILLDQVKRADSLVLDENFKDSLHYFVEN